MNLIQQQVKEETDLMCYVWSIAHHFPENDLTSTSVEVIKECFYNKLSVRDAAAKFAEQD